MEKHIRKISIRMSVITVALVALGVWQWDFIWHGIEHNIYVNSAIFLTIIAGVIVAFYNVSRLKNEIVAFKALKEIWSDARDGPDKAILDPFWRHYRCMTPAIVFQRPRILGHVFDLVTEEIGRTKKFSISVETMQTLVHKIDAKLAEEKSLLAYMSGLLVFMGLIGTFMGLLKMVGSIAGILSGLQALGSGSGGEDPFGMLMTQLQEPLGGMATGFASSLFGLFGSLVVGLLGRYAHQAASTLKHEFESWLAAVAQIENGGAASVQVIHHAGGGDGRTMRLMADLVADFGKASRTFEGAVDHLARMSQRQDDQARAIDDLSDRIGELTLAHQALLPEIRQIGSLGPAAAGLGGEMRALGDRLIEGFSTGFQTLDATSKAVQASQTSLLGTMSASHAQMAASLSDVMVRLTAREEAEDARAADYLADVVAPRLADIADRVQKGEASRDSDLAARLDSDRRLAATLEAIRRDLGRRPEAGSTAELEGVLAAGLAEISRNMETAFSTFAQIARLAVVKDGGDREKATDDFDTGFDDVVPVFTPSLPAGGFAEALQRRKSADGTN